MIAICPKLALLANFQEHYLVPGRCMGLSLNIGDKYLHVLNLHNYSLSFVQIQQIGNFMSSLAQMNRDSPDCSFSVLVGDLNFRADGERNFKVGRDFVGVPDRNFISPVFLGP